MPRLKVTCPYDGQTTEFAEVPADLPPGWVRRYNGPNNDPAYASIAHDVGDFNYTPGRWRSERNVVIEPGTDFPVPTPPAP